MKLCGDFLLMYFIQISKTGDAEQDACQWDARDTVQYMMKAISAKEKDAGNRLDESAGIADEPAYQKRNIRQHSGIADALLPFPLELSDVVFCRFSFFVQALFYHRRSPAVCRKLRMVRI